MRSTMFVALGGVGGATVRWSVGELVGHDAASFPWATFIVNIVGCALIGLAGRRLDHRTDAWYVIVTGFLGGLTTFSAFAVETQELIAGGHGVTAMLYVAASVLVGVTAVELVRGRGEAA